VDGFPTLDFQSNAAWGKTTPQPKGEKTMLVDVSSLPKMGLKLAWRARAAKIPRRAGNVLPGCSHRRRLDVAGHSAGGRSEAPRRVSPLDSRGRGKEAYDATGELQSQRRVADLLAVPRR